MEAIRKSEYSSPTPIQAQVGRRQKHGESFRIILEFKILRLTFHKRL